MADISRAELTKEINSILKNADLDVMTSKKVRTMVEQKLSCDLSARKKEIDTIVMNFTSPSDEEDDAGGDDNQSADSDDEKPAPVKSSSKNSRTKRKKDDSDNDDSDDSTVRRSRKKKSKKSEKKPRKTTPGKGNNFTRAYKLSPELSSLMGAEALPRHEVVKKVWAIIKERNLYDPKNKQYAICDPELHKVMGIKRFRTFGMLKYLKVHFINE